MIAVIFEVEPTPALQQAYLDMAASLRHELEQVDGFLSIERFASMSQPGRILSLSYWRDEEAVAQWRNLEAHRLAQARGRDGMFLTYRLRVAEVVRDYGLLDRAGAPPDARMVHG